MPVTAKAASQELGITPPWVKQLAARYGLGTRRTLPTGQAIWTFTRADIRELRRIMAAHPPGGRKEAIRE